MPEKPWKRTQRTIARSVGGKRLISLGASGPNVVSDNLVLEVRLRKELPRWIVEGVEKARRFTTRWRLGGLVMREEATGAEYIVLRLSDYLAWHGGKESLP